MAIILNKNTARYLEQQSNKAEFINKLYDTEFNIGGRVYDVSFKDTQLSPESKVILRHAIVEAFGGYGENGENGELELNINHSKALPRFINYLSTLEITHILEEFNYECHLGFITYLLKQGAENNKSKYDTYSLQTIIHSVSLLNTLAKQAQTGKASWGTHSLISLDKVREVSCAYLEKHTNVDILEWLYGGSLETASFTTAMFMLNYALNQLDSLECQIFSSYFYICKQQENFTWWVTRSGVISVAARIFMKHGHFDFNSMDEYGKDLPKRHAVLARLKSSRLPKLVDKWYMEVKKNHCPQLDFSDFHKIVSKLFASNVTISNVVNKYYSCALGVISILTGIRVHELSNIKASTALSNKNDIVYLTTRIDKTHQGLPVSRSTGDAVAIAVNALLNISYIDKTEPIEYKYNRKRGKGYCSIFFKATTTSTLKLVTTTRVYNTKIVGAWLDCDSISQRSKCRSLNHDMRRLYDLTLGSLPNNLRDEVIALEETITVHAFRHIFVDFLLRRFDGDVIRAIRRCFAHSSKDVMNYVQNYIRNKVAPHVQKSAERAYAQELIKRIAGDINRTKFTGAAIEYVRSRLDKMKWTTMDELDELVYDWVASGDSKLIRLVPHSYGFCMLFKGREHLARCWDKGVVKVDKGESGLCIGCANVGVHDDSHLTTLNQLQLVHMNILSESSKPSNIMSLLGSVNTSKNQESTRIIKTIEILKQQLKADGTDK